MKTIFITSVFLFFCVFPIKAQHENYTPDFYQGVLFGYQNAMNYIIPQVNQNSIEIQNLVNIKQIGNFNTVDANIQSLNLNAQLNQLGDNNRIDVLRNDRQTMQFIYQQGNNNEVRDYSLHSYQNTNLNFVQLGNNLKLSTYGTNSIVENLSIFQKGNAREIIILNK
ncbi:hypothetical protein [Flavobacterium luminosum]|uniref:Curlin associated repeat-containing protein n=1 Tax=Flavobacterium luminosum TaxID=2949086 RepID=A0ABT0TLK7_9FLAO|nr:hypothetical protein [Flavobacterium sp. HXWNR70]MCL9808369.1 hypothetical protein [Flavobacterium sp. HXWNR70]